MMVDRYPNRKFCKWCGSKLTDTDAHTTEWQRGWMKNEKLHRSRLYRVYASMRTRCTNQNSQKYHRYGARGVNICNEWEDFSVFRQWSLAHGYGPDLSIDRIDNDGNYKPDNCQWIPLPENKAKLTPDDVRAIRAHPGNHSEVGRIYGVYPSHISRIRTGEQRGNVK